MERKSGLPVAVKLVVVGDASVGKTCLLESYTKDRFPQEYVPTVFQNTSTMLKVDSKMINLGIWDTAGQQEYAKLRTLAYANCDVFLVVFDVNQSVSFKNACKKWIPQLNSLAPGVVKILVGNKVDLRKEGSSQAVSKSTAESVSKQLQVCYVECSAKTQFNLKNLFEIAIREVLKKKEKKKESGCSLI